MIYSDLTNYIKTTRNLDDFSSEIDKLLESIFQPSINKSFDSALKEISVRTAGWIKDVFLKNNLDISNREVIKNFLTRLKEQLKKYKTIKLTIAFEPSYSSIENIYNWVLEALDNSYILDIDVNTAILGGAIVVFNGQYRDLTLKKNLKDLFNTKRGEILPYNSKVKI